MKKRIDRNRMGAWARGIGLGLGLSVCFIGAFAASPPEGTGKTKPQMKTIDFNRDVRPILAKNCWTCHGPDKDQLKRTGNMKLDSFEGATQDRGGYRAITPFKPDKSVLLTRIVAEDATRMPPLSTGGKPLTKAEQAILRKWIEEGAEYRAHWAYLPPKMPTMPKVGDPKWTQNPIDAFIRAKQAEEGLGPEPEADRPTLIRRATLTLTGLPPTPAEVDAFVKDTKPGAYERVVDRLLASPRYGEHQARYWLDAVRYADTHGLHIDNERSVYPYRDWVIKAYNQDLPFDKFTIWQLAGDLLKNPTIDQKIATGYVRMNPTTNEGGVIEAEFLAKNTMDRVDTTATVFLGVTLGCAKCHDHKYDPFTAKDYYRMYAFFNSTRDAPLDGNLKLHEPVLKAPTSEQAQRIEKWSAQIRDLVNGTKYEEAQQWAMASAPQLPKADKWEVSGPYDAKDFESGYATVYAPEPGSGKEAVWRPTNFKTDQATAGVVGKENAAGYLRGYVTVDAPITAPVQISSDDAVKVWVNGKLAHENKILRGVLLSTDNAKFDLKAGRNEILIKIVNSGGPEGAYLSFGDDRARRLAKAYDLSKVASRTEAQNKELASLYLELGPDSMAAKEYRKATADLKSTEEAIPMTYVAEELPMLRETRILRRGEYHLPGPVVYRGIPEVFGGLPTGYPKNRLGLAQWLVSPENPLTARVFVNRVWQQHFGTGIVRSSEDFGSRGELPTHPELLDYLAIRLIKDGWSLKKMHKLILTSATFRQASTASAKKRAKDPENLLYTRAPRFRLDAEVIRDYALYASGLLVERPGGRGDKPYMPAGIWEAIAFNISDTGKYVQDHGEALYRRSLYLFWKRTSPPPTMLLFDAPMRESCIVKRSRTNTPTQALATMNETGFAEAARAMAQRVLKSATTDAARIDNVFRLALGRTPSDTERKLTQELLDGERTHYRARVKEAVKAISVGEAKRDTSLDPVEHVSWMMVCNMVLNLDEALTMH